MKELTEFCGAGAWNLTPEVLARFPDVLTVTKAEEDLEMVSADICAVLSRRWRRTMPCARWRGRGLRKISWAAFRPSKA